MQGTDGQSSVFEPKLVGRVDYVLGLHKFTRFSSLPHDEGLFVGLLPDLALLLALLLHREMLLARGLAAQPSDAIELPPDLRPAAESIAESEASERPPPAATPGATDTATTTSHTRLTMSRDTFGLEGACEDGDEPLTVAGLDTLGAVELSNLLHRATDPEPQPGLAERWRQAAEHARAAALQGAQASRRFAARLLPEARDAKEGVDLYMSSSSVCLLLLVYMFVFLAPMTRPSGAGASGEAGAELAAQISNSQISSSTVLGLFVGIGVMIADRMIYRLWKPPATISAAIPAHDSAPTPGDESTPPDRAKLSRVSPAASSDAEGGDCGVAGREEAGCGDEPRHDANFSNLAPALKLLLHVSMVLSLHLALFFNVQVWVCDATSCGVDPSTPCCTRNLSAIFFYLLACGYLFLSGSQVGVS